MRNLFGTADVIGTETGGGVVTRYELQALQDLPFPQNVTITMDAKQINPGAYKLPNSPYAQDYLADAIVLQMLIEPINIAHFYSGMFGKTIWRLKNSGVKVTQTIAAHDSKLSREEFQKLGMAYDFPHINERFLWLTYIEGQLMADKVICPSTASKKIVEEYGVKDATVIPHGIPSVPDGYGYPHKPDGTPVFNVGYLGQCGPDKGLRYLFEAWSKLNLQDSKLMMAGRDMEQMAPLWQFMGGKGEVYFMGYVKHVSELYNGCRAYVQPSVTEGFGIEVLEAMAYGRPVIVSEGAGAADVVTHGVDGFVVPRRDPDAIAECILKLKNDPVRAQEMGKCAHEKAKQYTWDKIIPKYHEVWMKL